MSSEEDESVPQVLVRLIANLKPVDTFADMLARGIWGFSWVYGPRANIYTRLHMTDDYDAVACRTSERWFRSNAGVMQTFRATMDALEVPAGIEVAGIYRMGFEVQTVRACY